jgi:hypothetical protein
MAIQDSDLFVVGRSKDVKSATGKDVKNFIDTEFINQAGDSMTGELNVQYPTDDNHASSKEYVDEEIFKIQNQLDEVGSNLRNGTFQLKNPGVFIPPSAGEFSLVNASDETTDTVADTVVIAISNETREGETQMFDDVENGYIQFKVAGSSDAAVFTIDSIETSEPSDPTYSQLRVTYHAGNGSTIANDSICYVNTLRIDGVDLDDLQQALDDRYVKLVGDSEVIGDIHLGTSPGSTNITLDNTGDITATGKITANSYYGDGSKLTNLPPGRATLSDTEPPIADHVTGEFWLDTISYELYVLAELPDGSIAWVDTCCDDYMPLDISILPEITSFDNPPYYKEYMPTDISILPSLLDPSTP